MPPLYGGGLIMLRGIHLNSVASILATPCSSSRTDVRLLFRVITILFADEFKAAITFPRETERQEACRLGVLWSRSWRQSDGRSVAKWIEAANKENRSPIARKQSPADMQATGAAAGVRAYGGGHWVLLMTRCGDKHPASSAVRHQSPRQLCR